MAQGGLIARRAFIAAKVEVTPGTDVVPVWATDAFVAYEVKVTPFETLESFQRHPLCGHFSSQTPIVGKGHAGLTFKFPLIGKGDGAAIDAQPPVGQHAVFAACGLVGTQQAAVSYTYNPTSAATTVTVYVAIDGKLHAFLGSVGDWTITGENGKPLMVEVKMIGAYVKPVDLTLPTTAVLRNVVAPPFLGAAFNLWARGTKPICNQFKIQAGNKMVGREDVNAGAGGVPGGRGYRAFLITDKDMKFSCQVEEEKVADFDYWAQVTANTAAVFTTGTVGSTAGSRVLVSGTGIGMTGCKQNEKDGIVVLDLEGTPATSDLNVGNDEMAVVFS